MTDLKSNCNNELFIIYFQGLLNWVDVPNLLGMTTHENKEPLDKLTNYRNTTWFLALPESKKYYLPPSGYLIPMKSLSVTKAGKLSWNRIKRKPKS